MKRLLALLVVLALGAVAGITFAEVNSSSTNEAFQIYRQNNEAKMAQITARWNSIQAGQNPDEGLGRIQMRAEIPIVDFVIDETRYKPVWVADRWNHQIVKYYDFNDDGEADGKVIFARNIAGVNDLYVVDRGKVIAGSAWGYLYILTDTNGDGVADVRVEEETPFPAESVATGPGGLYLVSSHHPLRTMFPFFLVPGGLSIPRDEQIFNGADLAVMVRNGKNELYGVDTWDRSLRKFNFRSENRRYGYADRVADFTYFQDPPLYPVGLTFVKGRAIALFADWEVCKPGTESGSCTTFPGSIQSVDLGPVAGPPRMRRIAYARALLSSNGGLATQTTAKGNIRMFVIENYGRSREFSSITSYEVTADLELVRVTSFVPPDLAGSESLGGIATLDAPSLPF